MFKSLCGIQIIWNVSSDTDKFYVSGKLYRSCNPAFNVHLEVALRHDIRK